MIADVPSSKRPLRFPDSDGKPMSDNTLHSDWMDLLHGNLVLLYADEPNVFVAKDLLWYPEESNDRIRQGPDVMVAFGRPKKHRGSYQQWSEENIPPQVVFEVLSPGNRAKGERTKLRFYTKYGVEEYFIYNPFTGELEVRVRKGDRLPKMRLRGSFVSPRLGIRFEWKKGDEGMKVFHPDGSPFLSLLEIDRLLEATQRERDAANQRADEEKRRADNEKHRADEAEAALERAREAIRKLGMEPTF